MLSVLVTVLEGVAVQYAGSYADRLSPRRFRGAELAAPTPGFPVAARKALQWLVGGLESVELNHSGPDYRTLHNAYPQGDAYPDVRAVLWCWAAQSLLQTDVWDLMERDSAKATRERCKMAMRLSRHIETIFSVRFTWEHRWVYAKRMMDLCVTVVAADASSTEPDSAELIACAVREWLPHRALQSVDFLYCAAMSGRVRSRGSSVPRGAALHTESPATCALAHRNALPRASPFGSPLFDAGGLLRT